VDRYIICCGLVARAGKGIELPFYLLRLDLLLVFPLPEGFSYSDAISLTGGDDVRQTTGLFILALMVLVMLCMPTFGQTTA
jgi:hypothetical protein